MKINDFIPNTSIYKEVNLKEVNLDEKKTENQSISSGFSNTLKEKLNEVNDKQIEAENKTEDFIQGKDTSIHNVMLKTEEAKLSLQLAVQVRNKLLEAYQEMNRMQV